MRPESPCKNCQDRYLGCHSHCIAFKAYKDADEKEKSKIYQGRKEHSFLYGRTVWTEGKRRAIRAEKGRKK